MKHIIFFLFFVVYCQVFSQTSLGDELENYNENLNTITTAVPFLTISPDSRSGAMGDVGAATSPDVHSIHWNPTNIFFLNNEDCLIFIINMIQKTKLLFSYQKKSHF